jgi:uncharacterized membrane protein YfcA
VCCLLQVGGLDWNVKTLTLFPTMSLFAGIMAGMMGLGGGMLKGPLLLEVGDISSVESATATCAFMIVCMTGVSNLPRQHKLSLSLSLSLERAQ